MNDSFESIQAEKKEKIIYACIEEFANYGYEKASTNSIVKKAGISKGLLFHYFGSKKNIFFYTLDYTINFVLKKYYKETEDKPSDLFERMLWAGMLKIRIFYEEPLMFKLLIKSYMNLPDELREDIAVREAKIRREQLPAFFEGIDTSKIRKGVDINMAIEIIILFLEGISNKYIDLYREQSSDDLLNNMEKLMKEFNEYFEILKGGIYQE